MTLELTATVSPEQVSTGAGFSIQGTIKNCGAEPAALVLIRAGAAPFWSLAPVLHDAAGLEHEVMFKQICVTPLQLSRGYFRRTLAFLLSTLRITRQRRNILHRFSKQVVFILIIRHRELGPSLRQRYARKRSRARTGYR